MFEKSEVLHTPILVNEDSMLPLACVEIWIKEETAKTASLREDLYDMVARYVDWEFECMICSGYSDDKMQIKSRLEAPSTLCLLQKSKAEAKNSHSVPSQLQIHEAGQHAKL